MKLWLMFGQCYIVWKQQKNNFYFVVLKILFVNRIVMLNDAVLRLRKTKDIIPQSSRSKFGFGSSKRESIDLKLKWKKSN